MKKMVAVMLTIALVASLVYPAAAHAGHAYVVKNYYGPPPHSNYSHHNGSYYNGWAIAGAAVGGVLLGAVIGSAVAAPRYAAAPAPAYAYPDSTYGTRYQSEAPPGEWVMVPGKWVNGKWVSAHRAWVPVNPY